MKKEIGKEISNERCIRRMALYRVGKNADVQPCIIKRIEAGSGAYSIDSLVKICKVLDLEVRVMDKRR